MSKYKEWISEEGLLTIEDWARNGLTDEQIAENIGINRTTLYGWFKKHPDLKEAVLKGRRPITVQIENALIKRALGYTEEEVTEIQREDEDGNKWIERRCVQRSYPPDINSIIFYLQNHCKDRYTEGGSLMVR